MRQTIELTEHLVPLKERDEPSLIVEVEDQFMESAKAFVPVLDRFIDATFLVRTNPYLMRIIDHEIKKIDWTEKEANE